jgi:AraC-like DNA-binding protein
MDLRVFGLVPREPVVVKPAADACPSIAMSLEAGIAQATMGDRSFALDRTGLLVVPSRRRVVLETRVTGARVCVLSIPEPLSLATEKRYDKLGFDREKLGRWLADLSLLPRTVWVHEIVHRYVFEREALNEHDNLATRFLEIEIVKELYFLFRDREEEGADRANIAQRYSVPVERAIAWIEAHLFESRALSMKALTRHAGASESTLLRSFRRELGVKPGEYWRTRRLDEAMVLLRSGRYGIAELATRTGYDNPTSFTFAFQKHFGHPPTHFFERRPTKRAP